jgi:hypothetical protein
LVEDGQHRLAAAALSGFTWTIIIVFGVDSGSVDTIDGGRRRSGADHAFLDGIMEPSKKQAIVRSSANYFVRSGNTAAALRSEQEVKLVIEANDALLDQAMEIGAQSREHLPDPMLKESTASAIAYVLMKSEWPVQTIREKLAYFQQSRSSTLGENDPFFVAMSLLADGQKKAARGERMTITREMGITILAIVEAQKGTKAVHKRKFSEAVKRSVPDPRYPIAAAHEAAA